MSILAALLSLPTALGAADSLEVRCPQIPILLDRIDNVFFQIRVPDAKPGMCWNPSRSSSGPGQT